MALRGFCIYYFHVHPCVPEIMRFLIHKYALSFLCVQSFIENFKVSFFYCATKLTRTKKNACMDTPPNHLYACSLLLWLHCVRWLFFLYCQFQVHKTLYCLVFYIYYFHVHPRKPEIVCTIILVCAEFSSTVQRFSSPKLTCTKKNACMDTPPNHLYACSLLLWLHCVRWLLSASSAPNTERNASADTHGHTRTPMHILICTHFRTPTGLFVTSFPGSLSAIEEAWQMGVWER